MSDIPIGEVPSLLLRTVPETGELITEKFQAPAEAAVLTQDAAIRLHELPAECLTTPVLMPQLESPVLNVELLRRCWDFVEQVVDHPSEHVSGAAYFEVLEPLLNADGLVEAAWPHMKGRTRACTVRRLDFYGVFVPGINRR